MSEELKPCPFCGGSAALHSLEGHDGLPYYWIECSDCYCQTPIKDWAEGVEEVWYRRVDSQTSNSQLFAGCSQEVGDGE